MSKSVVIQSQPVVLMDSNDYWYNDDDDNTIALAAFVSLCLSVSVSPSLCLLCLSLSVFLSLCLSVCLSPLSLSDSVCPPQQPKKKAWPFDPLSLVTIIIVHRGIYNVRTSLYYVPVVMPE